MSKERMYTINDYLNDKNDMEIKIEELRKKRKRRKISRICNRLFKKK